MGFLGRECVITKQRVPDECFLVVGDMTEVLLSPFVRRASKVVRGTE